MSVEQYRRKADDLLRQASGAQNMKERGRLIDEAMHWHRLALEVYDSTNGGLGDDRDADGEASAPP